MNSLEDMDKCSETDGAAQNQSVPLQSYCNMIAFPSLFLKGNYFLVFKMSSFQTIS
jgi:hypothetical protein